MTRRNFNRRLVLEHVVRAPDGAGGFTETWEVLGTLWAEVRAGTGREAAGEEITLSSVAYRVFVRGAPIGSAARPEPGQRFREGQRVFAIQAVAEADPAGRVLVCFAREEEPA